MNTQAQNTQAQPEQPDQPANPPITLALDEQGILQVVMGDGYDNDEIVSAASTAAQSIEQQVMGKVLLVNGRQTVPLCYVLAHAFAHLVPAIGVFDPKLKGYVVTIAHGPDYNVGQVIKP